MQMTNVGKQFNMATILVDMKDLIYETKSNIRKNHTSENFSDSCKQITNNIDNKIII